MSLSAYQNETGTYFYIVETGQPTDPVRVGEGPTIQAAIANLSDTPIQSTGRDGGERAALEWTLTQDSGAALVHVLYDADDLLPEGTDQ